MKISGNYAVIGGDARSVCLINSLLNDGNSVSVYALERQNIDKRAKHIGNLRKELSEVDFVVLPMPLVMDNKLNAPFSNKEYYPEEILNLIPSGKLVFAGSVPSNILKKAEANDIKLIDYLDRDELRILNAIPTAEGALQIAMEEMPITLHGSKALVMGFGRIGKVLCKMLAGIGAEVSVSVRSSKDKATAMTYGYKACRTSEIRDLLGEFDLVINTIPSMVLEKDELAKISDECLIIDLASKPGGVDFNTATELSKKVIWALSLPGKVAPVSAAKAIRDTIYNIIREEGRDVF